MAKKQKEQYAVVFEGEITPHGTTEPKALEVFLEEDAESASEGAKVELWKKVGTYKLRLPGKPAPRLEKY